MTGCPGLSPRLPGRGHDEEPRARRRLGGLREAVLEVARLVVPAAAHVHDADAVAPPVADHPLDPAADVVVLDPARGADLDQDESGLGGEPAVEAAREPAVPAGHDRRHHAVPARLVGLLEVGAPCPGGVDVDVAQDAVARLHEVGVGVEAGVEEGDGDAPPGAVFRGAQADRGRQDRHPAPGEAGVVGLRLGERGGEARGARRAQARFRAPPRVVGEDEQQHLGVEVLRARGAARAEVGPAERALASVAHGGRSIRERKGVAAEAGAPSAIRGVPRLGARLPPTPPHAGRIAGGRSRPTSSRPTLSRSKTDACRAAGPRSLSCRHLRRSASSRRAAFPPRCPPSGQSRVSRPAAWRAPSRA